MNSLTFISPSADVHLVAPTAPRGGPAPGLAAAAPAQAVRGGLAAGFPHGWLLGGLAAAAATASRARRMAATRHAGQKESPVLVPGTASGGCRVCGVGAELPRRELLGAGLAAAVPAAPAAALFEGAPFDRVGEPDAIPLQVTPEQLKPMKGPKCPVCVGKGIMRCVMCEGTGNYRNLGQGTPRPERLQVDFVRCPECAGAGSRVCDLCIGTGLPNTELRGILRKPEFAAVIKRLKTTGVQLDKLVQYQADVRAAVEAGKAA